MSDRALQQTDKLLELLHDAGIEFVVIGDVAAICHGSAMMTVERLLSTLRPFHPKHVTRPDLGVIRDPIEYLAVEVEP